MDKRYRPTESTSFLLNPHKGCATFQHFNGDPLFEGTRWSEEGPLDFPDAIYDVAPGYLPTTVAYCRWYWNVLEPDEGRYDFSMVEGALETAHARGQTLQVRLMPHGSSDQAPLPQWYIDNYPTVEGTKKRKPYVAAVYDGPEYVDKWTTLVQAFGERFDGHPDLESVDMAFIGPWGEGAGDCSDEAVDTITDAYRLAHPKTHRVAMIEEYKMTAGVRSGAGWRCDCFGDLGIWLNPKSREKFQFNHMYDYYPQSVVECGALDTWRTAPLTFESCGVPMTWYNKGFDIDFIVQQGLKFHGTVLMPKSTALPGPWWDKLERFCNDLGYRFVIRQLFCDGSVNRGGPWEFGCWIENVGVAPIAYRYDFALRFTQGRRSEVVTFKEHDIRAWLPGDAYVHETIPLPGSLEPGTVEIHAALLDAAGKPKVRFAVEESDAEGWVALDTIEVTA